MASGGHPVHHHTHTRTAGGVQVFRHIGSTLPFLQGCEQTHLQKQARWCLENSLSNLLFKCWCVLGQNLLGLRSRANPFEVPEEAGFSTAT